MTPQTKYMTKKEIIPKQSLRVINKFNISSKNYTRVRFSPQNSIVLKIRLNSPGCERTTVISLKKKEA